MSTSGSYSDGIDAYSQTGYVHIFSNAVTTTGAASSSGIQAFAYQDVQIYSNSVHTSGTDSRGITGLSYAGPVSINSSGTVATAGDGSTGIAAASLSADVNVTSGTVTTLGNHATGILALSDPYGYARRPSPSARPTSPPTATTASA